MERRPGFLGAVARTTSFVLMVGFAASMAVARPLPPQTNSPNQVIDLRECAWRGSDGASASRRGELLEIKVRTLVRPAPRTVSCSVHLSGNEPKIVEGFNHGAVTEDGWTFVFERRDGSLAHLYHGSQEGRFRFRVPSAWSHDPDIRVLIGIPGDNPGYLHLSLLELRAAPDIPATAPQPLAPLSGDSPTPAATDFFWSTSSLAAVSAYDFECRGAGGPNERLRLPAYFESDADRVSPPEWLAPGHRAWRVRAINLRGVPGPWSAWTAFDVLRPSPLRAPDLAPSARHPLFLMDLGGSDPPDVWREIPPDIRGHLLLRTGGSVRAIQKMLVATETNQIPIALQVNGPHDIIAGHWDRLPLVLVRQWAEQYPNLKAFYICEQAVQGGIHNAEVRDYLRRLIAIGGETGRPVIWADANWGRNVWLDVVADSNFSRFLRDNPGYAFPVWKMNGGFVPYLAPAGLLGLWLDHSVTEWGVQPESWYWVEAGFRQLGVQGDYKEGVRTAAPTVLFQQLALLGASAGATIYSFEPGGDLLSGGLGRGDALQTIFVPLARLLLDSAIPSGEQVRNAVFQWRRVQSSDLVFRKNYSATLHHLFARTLGIGYPFEAIPESGACYWIPFVDDAFPLATGRRGTGQTSREASCRTPAIGRAAVFRVGQFVFVFNSQVNWRKDQQFSFHTSWLHCSGVLGLGGWLEAKETNPGEVRLWFYARRGMRTALDFQPAVIWRPAEGGPPDWSPRPISHREFVAGTAPDEIVVRRAGE
jgi:hypothetical protein